MTDCKTLETEYSDTKSKREIAWPLANNVYKNKCLFDPYGYYYDEQETDDTQYSTPNRVPECGYRMCPSVIEIRINPSAVRRTIKTQTDKR